MSGWEGRRRPDASIVISAQAGTPMCVAVGGVRPASVEACSEGTRGEQPLKQTPLAPLPNRRAPAIVEA